MAIHNRERSDMDSRVQGALLRPCTCKWTDCRDTAKLFGSGPAPHRGNLAAYLLAYTALWSVKISFIVSFRKFGDKLLHQEVAWLAVLGFCIASFAVCIGTVDYHCLTSSGMRMIRVCQEPRTLKFEYVTLRLTTSLDFLPDLSIILLSTNVLWRIRLRLWTKVALAGIFSLTLFVITIAIIRIVFASRNGKLDLSWLVCWQGVEVSIAIIIVSLASFRILYTSTHQTSRSAFVQPNQILFADWKGSKPMSGEREWTELSDAPSGSASRGPSSR